MHTLGAAESLQQPTSQPPPFPISSYLWLGVDAMNITIVCHKTSCRSFSSIEWNSKGQTVGQHTQKEYVGTLGVCFFVIYMLSNVVIYVGCCCLHLILRSCHFGSCSNTTLTAYRIATAAISCFEWHMHIISTQYIYTYTPLLTSSQWPELVIRDYLKSMKFAANNHQSADTIW